MVDNNNNNNNTEGVVLLYIPNFINTTICKELVSFCERRFVPSQIRGHSVDATTTTHHDMR